MTVVEHLLTLAGERHPEPAYSIFWGGVGLLVGGVLAANVLRAAEWMQVVSYSYRSWPESVRTVRLLGGVIAVGSAVPLGSAVLSL